MKLQDRLHKREKLGTVLDPEVAAGLITVIEKTASPLRAVIDTDKVRKTGVGRKERTGVDVLLADLCRRDWASFR